MFEKPTTPVQPLRIPTGWTVEWNLFHEEDPTFEVGDARSIGFGEDLLHISHARHAVLLDLGWYPSGDPDGEYRAVVIRKYSDAQEMVASWDRPLRSLSTRSRGEVVQTIEDWLWHFAHHPR